MKRETVAHLAQRIHEIEASERPLVQTTIPFPPLADALPDGGLPSGSLVEIVSALDGDGAWTFAMLLARCACAERKTLVIADGQRTFYPPAAARLGIDLQRTLILRPADSSSRRRGDNGVAPLVQSLRCPAVGAVLGRFERLTAAEYRSLQLAAQTGGGVGFLLRPVSARGDPSFADVRLQILSASSEFSRGSQTRAVLRTAAKRRIQIEVLRARGGKTGRTFVLEIDHETGDVRLLPRLADATPLACSARAS